MFKETTALIAFALVSLASCSSSSGLPDASTSPALDGAPVDAKSAPPPDAMWEQLQVSGTTLEPNGNTASFEGGSFDVSALDANGQLMASATSAVDGTFAFSVYRPDSQTEVIIESSVGGGTWPTRYFAPDPSAMTYQDIDLYLTSPGLWTLLWIAGGPSQDPNNGVLFLTCVDAAGNRVEGCSVSGVSGEITYPRTKALSDPASWGTQTSDDGIIVVFNVPPGQAALTITGPGTYPSRTLDVEAETVVATHLLPQ